MKTKVKEGRDSLIETVSGKMEQFQGIGLNP